MDSSSLVQCDFLLNSILKDKGNAYGQPLAGRNEMHFNQLVVLLVVPYTETKRYSDNNYLSSHRVLYFHSLLCMIKLQYAWQGGRNDRRGVKIQNLNLSSDLICFRKCQIDWWHRCGVQDLCILSVLVMWWISETIVC